ncbi:hypothetical protein AVEN_51731-1 [Araneus ventricosus]|uniref:Uncharacterized protein n=1 Tax=Araneus ventricosus TaxID=182803 RepID=A0A4Y2GFY7_ARAVE|nr:hypothetical protein AVEN_51731-1 [Araneus ventricosus]
MVRKFGDGMPVQVSSSSSDRERKLPEIVTDDEEIDDACTRTDHGHVAFDEKIQEETDGTIKILKEKDAAEYV